jgi:hypothetical protein
MARGSARSTPTATRLPASACRKFEVFYQKSAGAFTAAKAEPALTSSALTQLAEPAQPAPRCTDHQVYHVGFRSRSIRWHKTRTPRR